jgi:thiol-disulfide isomerase/thioredoxin
MPSGQPRLRPSLRVLVAPTATFLELTRLQKGYGSLFGFLAIEYVLSFPLDVASHVMRASFSPFAALQGLWSSYVHFALPIGIALFVLGVLLYYAVRFKGPRRLDIWTAASLFAYAWVPHVLLVAGGTLLAAVGLDHAILPQHPLRGTGLGVPLLAVKAVIAYGPSAWLAAVAVRLSFRPTLEAPTGALPAIWCRAIAALVTALVLLSCGAASLKVASDWRSVRPVMPGDRLPAFTLDSVDGPPLSSEALTGDVLLFDFWATWCPACVAAMPGLDKLRTDFADRGFRLVSVNVESDDLPTVRRFVADHALHFPVYVDTGGLQNRFQVQTYPTLVLVDKRGQVREVFIGATSASTLRRAFEPLLDAPQ